MNPEFERFVFSGSVSDLPFAPMAHYDPDGDCIEFLMSNESYRAERLDSLVTVYIGRRSNEVVGSLIKDVSKYVREALDRFPGFKIEIHDGRIKLEHLFTLRLWESPRDPKGTVVLVYQKLREIAVRNNIEAELDISRIAA